MNGKRIIVIVLLGVMLASCGGKAPAETSVPTVTQTQVAASTAAPVTQPPVATEAPATEAPTAATATSESRPTNAPDCTNSASFVSDVTFPDNTNIDGGATFTKTWRIANTGTCIWAGDYTLTHYSEENMGAPAVVPLSLTYPGQNADISVELTAPNSVGTHRGYFVVKNPEDLIMKIGADSRLWVIINVQSVTDATVAPTNAPVAVATATVSASGGGTSSGVTCGYSIDQSKVLEVINAVNAYRGQFSMFAYTVNPQLAQAAQAHANDMACNQLFGHDGSDGSTVEKRVAASGYVGAYVGENAYGSNPPLSGQDVVTLWKNDATDATNGRNLVSDTYVDIGVGYAFYNGYGFYVIVFGSP